LLCACRVLFSVMFSSWVGWSFPFMIIWLMTQLGCTGILELGYFPKLSLLY
jgi:hypothetical protein